MNTALREFTVEDAREVAGVLGIDWERVPFGVDEFRAGMNVELEHGRRSIETNVTNDDPVMTGRIALAHLNEIPDYYERLAKMEAEAEG